MSVLVTGSAGFIGYRVARAFCGRGDEVVGTDNLNDYYEVSLKESRLRELEPFNNFRFVRLDLADRDGMTELLKRERFVSWFTDYGVRQR